MKLGQQHSRGWFMVISLIYSERMMRLKKIKNNWKPMTSWLWSWSWCQWWWVLMRRSQSPLIMLMMYLFQVMTTAFWYVPRHTADDMIYAVLILYDSLLSTWRLSLNTKDTGATSSISPRSLAELSRKWQQFLPSEAGCGFPVVLFSASC